MSSDPAEKPGNDVEPEPPQPQILADEKAQRDTATSDGTPLAATTSRSPPVSPPLSPPLSDTRRSSAMDYYSSRPKFDRLGNPIPERRKQQAMSSVYGNTRISLPGDLGPNDPRRPRSPAPNKLPGDLGPNDPRRQGSAASSPAPPDHTRSTSDTSFVEGSRLAEDPPRPEDEASGDEADADNDNEDTDQDESKRGRGRKRPEPGRTTSGKSVNIRSDSVDSELDSAAKPDPTKGESMLSLKKDGKGDKPAGLSAKKRVHPSTAFDVLPSAASTPTGSDDEGQIDFREAQQLLVEVSQVHSTPSAHRVVRQILRGNYAHFQREAEEGRKRQRMYLVATDLSPESQYALEWTIGTVLRDGDTLLAVYAVDEEEGVGGEGGVEIGQGARSVMDTAAIVKALPAITAAQQIPRSPGPSPLARAGNMSTENRSHSRGPHSSADAERRRAIEEISQRCIQLLRKTRLQVRVVVEVFHCKSPRHMITEVIDFLSPTLVIIGSRGRSAVKGVLLGSFSNYLVTKSSVPVMVARKKLRKHSKTSGSGGSGTRNPDGTSVPYSGSGRTGRFSNIIQAPKAKGLRVGSWNEVGID